MKITKPGDKEKRKKEIDGYLFTCENCGCEFECDLDEISTENIHWWGLDKGYMVCESFVHEYCPNCGKIANKVKTIWRDA